MQPNDDYQQQLKKAYKERAQRLVKAKTAEGWTAEEVARFMCAMNHTKLGGGHYTVEDVQDLVESNVASSPCVVSAES